MTLSEHEESISQIFSGRYRPERRVALGGMSEIWRGTDQEDGGAVAIKRLLINPEAGGEQLRARLLREADALRRFDHANVVRCLDAAVDNSGQPYLVLEWLEGEDLSARQRRAPLDQVAALEVARQALSGLAYCHELGVVHRDIKPANLFLVEGGDAPGFQVKLVDFGVARLEDRRTRLTRTGMVLGTLYYLAPEQVRGSTAVDHCADLYSLGVVLYELLTGRLPFFSEQAVAVMLKIVSETPVWPSQHNPELAPWLEEVILKAMRRSPSDRFRSAAEMRVALESGATSEDLARSSTVARERGTVPGLAPWRSPSGQQPVGQEPDRPGAPTGHQRIPSGSIEQRLVSLLCVDPLDTDHERPADVSAVRQAVERCGGRLQVLLGGQMVGLFGVERTLGDEALCAVKAGLVVRHTAALTCRIFVATIHVGVGEGLHLDSSELDRTSSILATLPPGELIVDASTRQLVQPHVLLAQRGPHHCVTDLDTDLTAPRLALGVQSPMVGRETELAGVRAAFERAVESQEPEAVVLVGPTGMGKSRVLQELLQDLRQRCSLCLEGRPDSSRQLTPFSLLADATSRAANIRMGLDTREQRSALTSLLLRHLSPEQAEEVAPLLTMITGLPGASSTAPLLAARDDPRVMGQLVSRAFKELIRAAGAEGPVCLCFDDLQWADTESLQLLEDLLEELAETPLFVLATCRPVLFEKQPDLFEVVEGERLELRPLRRRATGRLVRAVLGAEVSDRVVELLAGRAEGVPYFVEELISWMVGQRLLLREGGHWDLSGEAGELDLPAGIEGAIQGRLDQVAPDLKDLLKSVSIYGPTFWDKGCAVLGFDEADSALGRLEAEGFVQGRRHSRFAGARELSFKSSLVWQVAHSMLPPELHARLHLRAARWLEEAGETDAARLARHLEEGGDQARAAEYYSRAGAAALAEGRLEQAAAFYRSSQEYLEAPAVTRAERLIGLARSRYRLGQYTGAWEALEALDTVADAEASDGLLERRVLEGQLLFCQARYAEAEVALLAAAAMPEGSLHTERHFDAQQTLFWVFWAQGKYADAGRGAEDLIRMAELDGRADHLCLAKLALTYYHAVAGDLSLSAKLAGQAVEHARQLGHPFREVDALLMLGSARELVGQYPSALQALDEADQLAVRFKSTYHLAGIAACQGRIHLCLGDLKRAGERFRASVDLAREIGDERSVAIAVAGTIKVLCQGAGKEELSGGVEEAQRALELIGGKAQPVEAELRLALAQAALTWGQTPLAVEEAEQAVALLEQLGTQEQMEVEILLVAHDALVSAGRIEEARTRLDQAARRLNQRAQRISEVAVRESFLGEVPHNVRVKALMGD